MKFKIVEDAEKDHTRRIEAANVWKKAGKLPDSLWTITEGSTTLILSLEYVNKKYNDLDLLLARKQDSANGVTASFGHYHNKKDKYVIVVYCLMPERKMKDIFKNSTLEKSFVHEFIHYLDQKRYTLKYDENTVSLQKAGRMEDYVNTPSESNAYYQELTHDFEQFFRENVKTLIGEKDKYKKLIFGSFSAFLNFLRPFMKQGSFYSDLNEKNKKHFHRRLYGFYVLMKDKFEKAIAKQKD